MDFNNDSVIGNSFTTVESEGSVELQKTLWHDGFNSGTNLMTSPPAVRALVWHLSGWSLVAAETIDGQTARMHKNGRMAEWNVDDDWNYSITHPLR